jgi:hypothetical protein
VGDPVEVGEPLGRRIDIPALAEELDAVFDALDARADFLAQLVDFGALDRVTAGEGLVDVGEDGARGRVNLPQRVERGGILGVGGVFDEQLRVPQDVVYRSAEIVAQLRERRVLEIFELGRHGYFLPVAPCLQQLRRHRCRTPPPISSLSKRFSNRPTKAFTESIWKDAARS